MNPDILRIQNVSRHFMQGQTRIQVLKELTYSLKEGDSLAICGESGSGKTTLLSLIAGLDSPDAGEIIVAGQSLQKLSQFEITTFRARTMGIIFQQYFLLSHLTALENVALPLELAGDIEAESKAESILNQVGLGSRLKHFPHQLSGGENQRVAFARAFVVKPKLLLADEPSGSLDVKTGHAVMDILFELVKTHNTSLVLVTHNEDLANRCTHQYRFSL